MNAPVKLFFGFSFGLTVWIATSVAGDRPADKHDVQRGRMTAAAPASDGLLRDNDGTMIMKNTELLTLAELRFGVAGEDLAVHAKVADARLQQAATPWEGSCIEIFGALSATSRIGQVLLAPQVGAAPAKAYYAQDGKSILAPAIRLQTVPTTNGYELSALIPLALLALDKTNVEFLLEAQVTAMGSRGMSQRDTLFGSVAAYQDSQKFGKLVLKRLGAVLSLDQVKTVLAMEKPFPINHDPRREECIRRMTLGEGFMPWQKPGLSEPELAFRQRIERRKDRLLANRLPVRHPVMITEAGMNCARENIRKTKWAQQWFEEIKQVADHILAQPEGYVERMIPELTPTNPYGFTCPGCVGKKSQEGVGISGYAWDHRTPDVIRCKTCGQELPSAEHPETGRLVCPRMGQTFSYHLNEQERNHPDDRTGQYAWRWVGKPIHVSFSGIVRREKAVFAISAIKSLALMYRFSENPRYAEKAIQWLDRFRACYAGWLYHDFYDTIADCDPLYAAWHCFDLNLEWKRHPCESAYTGSHYETGLVYDDLDQAKMLATYFGSGKIHPSCDALPNLEDLAQAYDLIHDAADAAGKSLWTVESRARVERDLFLERIMGAEFWLGGSGKAMETGNKGPAAYLAFAAAGKCLGLPAYADVALRGYEAIRDKAFLFDGFSGQSPGYTDMFLSNILWVPELLHGFRWPQDFARRSGSVNVYKTDTKLRQIMSTALQTLRPDGRCLPLSDTLETRRPSVPIFEIALNRYPELFAGALPTVLGEREPGEYSVFHNRAERVEEDRPLDLPETLYPAWMTAILRHGRGRDATVLALPFNPPGGHRHPDNLALYYSDRGQTMLGDHGYIGDSPMNGWMHSTFSHNLVVVDDSGQHVQKKGADRNRVPSLRMMVTSPWLSVVEAESDCYDQCSEYRRLIALIKGPGAETFAVDIFRVRGGRKHAWRVFSELAASDAKDGALEFCGLVMPNEKPPPNFGASIQREHIFGLLDIRRAINPPAAWQATWKQRDRCYRLWMLTPSDRVEASNGPGQESHSQMGRRARYLDVIHEGADVASIFVALHEPGGVRDDMPVRNATRLSVPTTAGADALALRIESKWGVDLVFSEFQRETEVAGIRFKGKFAMVRLAPHEKRSWLTVGAQTLTIKEHGFCDAPAEWRGAVVSATATSLTTAEPRPKDWPELPGDVVSHVLVGEGKRFTGYPVAKTSSQGIAVSHFPLQPAKQFVLPAVRYVSE